MLGALAAAAAVGCAGPRGGGLLDKWNESSAVERFRKSAADPTAMASESVIAAPVVPVAVAAPAVEFACAWQKRPAQLPDPTRAGSMTPGLVGQVFLYTADMKPVEPRGELSVMVSDATERPAGVPPAKDEMYHFSADVLKRMAVNDERFGRSLAVFLPWPAEWRDVTRLQVQARYDQPGGTTLYAQPSTVTLDLSAAGGVWTKSPTAQTAAGVPDPRQAVKQATFSVPLQQQPTRTGVMPAGGPPAWPQQQSMQPQQLSMQPQPGTLPPNVKAEQAGDGSGTRIVIPGR